MWIAPGWCNEKIFSFLALDLIPSQLEPDKDEKISVLEFEPLEIYEMIMDKKIVDSKTISTFMIFYKNELKLQ